MASDSQVKQLKQEHAILDARLREIENHLSLTPDEESERMRLKKLKLTKKDEILRLTSDATS